MFRESWISIRANKLRSFLTILGVVIGVACVVLMVAVGQTIRAEIAKEIEAFGSNRMIILPNNSKRSGIYSSSKKPTLSFQDYQAISKIKDVQYSTAMIVVGSTINYNGNNWQTTVYGATEDYMYIDNLEMEEGNFFSDLDVELANNVAVIGQTVRDNLFSQEENVIGETIRIKNIPFVVIGVIKKRGSSTSGTDNDDLILTPLFTAKRKLTSNKFVNSVAIVMITAEQDNRLPFIQSRVENLLRERHSILENREDDFKIMNLEEIANRVNNIGVILSILLASIASISLFVGSIGIMNMMLVSVAERTREIGIRKAIGAKNIDILTQFLFESILISLIGSFIGMVLGIILSQIGGVIFQKQVPISVFTIIISALIAIFVGVASGIVPSKKATKLDPIVALRY